MNKPEGFDDTFKPQREDHVYNAEPQREDHTFEDNKPQRNDSSVGDVTPQRNDTLPDDGSTQRNDNVAVENKPQQDDNPVVTDTPPKPVANDIFDENGFYRISNTKNKPSGTSQSNTPPKPVANDIFDENGFYRISNTKSKSSGTSQSDTPPKSAANDISDDDFYREINSTIKNNSPGTSQSKVVAPPSAKSNGKGIFIALFVLAAILVAALCLKQYGTTDLPPVSDPTTTATTEAEFVEDTTEYTDDSVYIEEETGYASEVFAEEETEYTIAAEVFVGYNTVDFDSSGIRRYYFESAGSGYYEFKSDNSEDLKITLCVDGGLVLEDDDSGEGKNFVVVAHLNGDSFAHLDISPVSSDTYVSDLNLEITKVNETYAKGVELFKFYKENGIYIDNEQSMYNHNPDYSQKTSNWTNSGTKNPVSFIIKNDVLWLSFDSNHDTQGDITIWYPIELTDKNTVGYETFLYYKENGIYMTTDDTTYLSPDYSAEDMFWSNSKTYYPKNFIISEDSTLWLSFSANNDELGDHTIWYPIKLTDKYIIGYNSFLDYKDNGLYMTSDDTTYLSPDYSAEDMFWTNSKTYYPKNFIISEDSTLWLSFSANNDEMGEHSVWYPVKLS